MLEDRVFSTPEFVAWGADHAVLFAAVETRIEGRKDDALLQAYGFRSFPSLAVLDCEGGALSKNVERELYSMSNVVAVARDHRRIKAQVEAGEEFDAAAWFIARLGMGELDLHDARREMAGLELTPEQRRRADEQIFVMEMTRLLTPSRRRPRNTPDPEAVIEAVYAAFKKGKRLPPGSAPLRAFDTRLIKAAQDRSDAEAFFYSYERVRAATVASIARSRARIASDRKQLEELAGSKGHERQTRRYAWSISRSELRIEKARKQLAELDAHATRLKEQR